MEKAKGIIKDFQTKLDSCVSKIRGLEADKKSLLENNKTISKGFTGTLVSEAEDRVRADRWAEEAIQWGDKYKE